MEPAGPATALSTLYELEARLGAHTDGLGTLLG